MPLISADQRLLATGLAESPKQVASRLRLQLEAPRDNAAEDDE